MAFEMDSVTLVYVTAQAITQRAFLKGQNAFLGPRCFILHSVCAPGPHLDELVERDRVIAHAVHIPRTISLIGDIRAVWSLFWLLKEIKPDIVHCSTPIGAFLGGLAAWLNRVPVRIFFVRGLYTEDKTGAPRVFFRMLEKLTAKFCNHHIVVSKSLLEFARKEGILAASQGIILGDGMSNGVDVDRFDPERVKTTYDLDALRHSLGIPDGSIVIGYVGRMASDKGLGEIALAWKTIRDKYPSTNLLFVGPWDDVDESRLLKQTRARLQGDDRVHFTGYVDDTAPYYALMSIFVFASHGTEGFPNAPMEAAAMVIPTVATRVVGVVDGVVNGETGLLVPPRDSEALTESICRYLDEPDLRNRHGLAGRKRVREKFQQEMVWEATYQEYVRLMKEKGIPFSPKGID